MNYDNKYRWAIMSENKTGGFDLIKFIDTTACDVLGYELATAQCKPTEIVRYYDTIQA